MIEKISSAPGNKNSKYKIEGKWKPFWRRSVLRGVFEVEEKLVKDAGSVGDYVPGRRKVKKWGVCRLLFRVV